MKSVFFDRSVYHPALDPDACFAVDFISLRYPAYRRQAMKDFHFCCLAEWSVTKSNYLNLFNDRKL